MKGFCLWAAIFVILLCQVVSGGCTPKRWSPTDPRSLEPDASRIAIDDSLTISLGTTVDASSLP